MPRLSRGECPINSNDGADVDIVGSADSLVVSAGKVTTLVPAIGEGALLVGVAPTVRAPGPELTKQAIVHRLHAMTKKLRSFIVSPV